MKTRFTPAAASVYTTGDVARICGVAPRTASKWTDAGKLRCYRVPGPSGDRRIPHDDLVRFMRENGVPLNGLEDASPSRVLLLSADAALAASLGSALARGGRPLTHAATGFDAGVACVGPLSAAVLDFASGRSECVAIAAGLRKRHPEALLVALANEDEAEDLIALGFDATFVRPADVRAVARLLAEGRAS